MIEQASTITPEMGFSADSKRLLVLLAVPAQDGLTDYALKLLEDLPNLGAPTLLCDIKSPITYDDLLSQNCIDYRETDVALVFCGHGSRDSLFGPSLSDGSASPQTARSIFFNQSHVAIGPRFLLAFCSNAARELGEAYDKRTTNCTFVGFEDEIGMVLAEGIYAQWWRGILHGITSEMLRSPTTQELEKSISALYKQAISFFSTGDGRNHRWALMMRIYLRRQSEALRVIQT